MRYARDSRQRSHGFVPPSIAMPTVSSNFLDDVDRKNPNQQTTFDTIHTLTHHTLGSKSEAHCILDKVEIIPKGTFDQLIDSSFGV